MNKPDQCASMTEVRAGVDALDEQIVTLLGMRMRFMEAAARLKANRADVRDEIRKASVIAHACSVANRVAVPRTLVADLYEVLVEGSIAHELDCFDQRNPTTALAAESDASEVCVGGRFSPSAAME